MGKHCLALIDIFYLREICKGEPQGRRCVCEEDDDIQFESRETVEISVVMSVSNHKMRQNTINALLRFA
jgi:hypothetical protein